VLAPGTKMELITRTATLAAYRTHWLPADTQQPFSCRATTVCFGRRPAASSLYLNGPYLRVADVRMST
jgi:hypothetical protein